MPKQKAQRHAQKQGGGHGIAGGGKGCVNGRKRGRIHVREQIQGTAETVDEVVHCCSLLIKNIRPEPGHTDGPGRMHVIYQNYLAELSARAIWQRYLSALGKKSCLPLGVYPAIFC